MPQYIASVSREGQWWVADVSGVGTTQARSLEELDRMAVELVSLMCDVPADQVDVTFTRDRLYRY